MLRYRLDDLFDGTPAERWLRIARPFVPRARAWTVSHNGCSPRIARQFVDYIAGEGKA